MTLRATTTEATLAEVFGYPEFRPHQAEIIDHVSAGRDAFVLMPTGGGKSLCFQIPALHRHGVAVVVSPLIALMKDQVDALCANGVAAACLNSSLSAE
jgi:ATP-dependent DNA helicase RecQ